MNCFFCKGKLTDGTTTFMTEIDGCAVIIKMFLLKFALNAEKPLFPMRWQKN